MTATALAAPDSRDEFFALIDDVGVPCHKVVIAGTSRALAANKGGEVKTVPALTGAAEQLWQIYRLTDGTDRIKPKAIAEKPGLALVAIGASTPDARVVRSGEPVRALDVSHALAAL